MTTRAKLIWTSRFLARLGLFAAARKWSMIAEQGPLNILLASMSYVSQGDVINFDHGREQI
jgi:hypothetical protein